MSGTPSVHTERPTGMDQVGTIPSAALAAGVSIDVEAGIGALRQTRLKFTNVPVTLTDNGATGSGAFDFYTFPLGLIAVPLAISDLTYSSTGFTDAGLLSGIGTTAANADGDLADAGEGTIIPSTATAIAVTGTFKGKSTAATLAAGVFDGTTTAVIARLNLASPNDPVGNKTILVSGTVTLTWINGGDN